MTAEAFTYYLNGFQAAVGGNTPTQDQWNVIIHALDGVFNKVTPDRSTIILPVAGTIDGIGDFNSVARGLRITC